MSVSSHKLKTEHHKLYMKNRCEFNIFKIGNILFSHNNLLKVIHAHQCHSSDVYSIFVTNKLMKLKLNLNMTAFVLITQRLKLIDGASAHPSFLLLSKHTKVRRKILCHLKRGVIILQIFITDH